MNSKSNTQAMETEKIPRLLAQLAIPAVVAQIINLLYNIVDRIYIGHISGVGAAALTGVGLFTPILMLINAFAMLAGSGGASGSYGHNPYRDFLYFSSNTADFIWSK